MAERIILFDGLCTLCNRTVQFVIKRDPKVRFRFASLQSEVGKELLQRYDQPMDLQTIILLEGGQAYHRSSAALRISRRLRGAWPLLYAFILLPPPLRDIMYNLVARNRYKWFGKQEQCMIPTPNDAKRFLENTGSS